MMSDGSLTQDEIDALLSGGGDMFGDISTESTTPEDNTNSDLKAFEEVINNYSSSMMDSLSKLIDEPVSINSIKLSLVNRESLLSNISEQVVVLYSEFSGFSENNHQYLMTEDVAKLVAGKMIGQQDVEVNDVAISALEEAVGTMIGGTATNLTSLGKGDFSIGVSKGELSLSASIKLPAGDFVLVEFDCDINGLKNSKIYEIYSMDIVNLFLADEPTASPITSATDVGDISGLDELLGGSSTSSMSGGQSMGVQPVQFSNLSGQMDNSESGNISLLMDVFMEMTVELGRTKRLIKDILGMGEGTIIELDKLAGEPVDILVNHKLIAKGEVVVIDENFGVRVTEIISPMERVSDMM